MYETTDRMVSHPDHYQAGNGMEVIDVIEAFTADLKGIEATDTGNIIKYACRWKNKNGIQDLEKIMWYCQHLIDHLKAKEAKEVAAEEVRMMQWMHEEETKALERSAIRTKEEIFAGEPKEEIILPDIEIETEEKESK